MSVETPISSAEKYALIDNVKQVEMCGLTVEEVVCDGTATKQLNNLNIRKQHCLVHVAGCQKRRVIKAHLSNRMVGSSKSSKNHIKFKQILSRAAVDVQWNWRQPDNYMRPMMLHQKQKITY